MQASCTFTNLQNTGCIPVTGKIGHFQGFVSYSDQKDAQILTENCWFPSHLLTVCSDSSHGHDNMSDVRPKRHLHISEMCGCRLRDGSLLVGEGDTVKFIMFRVEKRSRKSNPRLQKEDVAHDAVTGCVRSAPTGEQQNLVAMKPYQSELSLYNALGGLSTATTTWQLSSWSDSAYMMGLNGNKLAVLQSVRSNEAIERRMRSKQLSNVW